MKPREQPLKRREQLLKPREHSLPAPTFPLVDRLHSLVPGTIEKALVYYEADSVTCVTAKPSGRQVFEVRGTNALPYVCFAHFCSCPAFLNSCILKQDELFVRLASQRMTSHHLHLLTLSPTHPHPQCKHQLAVRLAQATGRFSTRHQNGEVVMIMSVAISNRAAKQNHGVVQQ